MASAVDWMYAQFLHSQLKPGQLIHTELYDPEHQKIVSRQPWLIVSVSAKGLQMTPETALTSMYDGADDPWIPRGDRRWVSTMMMFIDMTRHKITAHLDVTADVGQAIARAWRDLEVNDQALLTCSSQWHKVFHHVPPLHPIPPVEVRWTWRGVPDVTAFRSELLTDQPFQVPWSLRRGYLASNSLVFCDPAFGVLAVDELQSAVNDVRAAQLIVHPNVSPVLHQLNKDVRSLVAWFVCTRVTCL